MRWLRRLFRIRESKRPTPKFVIRFARKGNGTEVFLDGKRLTQLTSVRVGTAVNAVTTVQLSFAAVEVDAEGDGDVITVTEKVG